MPNVKLWDKEKIEALFTTDIAKCIVYIPLLDVIEEDKLVWHDDIHGHYSVKSGYSLMQKMTGKVDSFFDSPRRLEIYGCGKCMLHRRQNIYCGAYVKGVFQLEFACKKGVLLALWYVLFVSIMMRTIGTF
jgi:hypothetical protein